MQAIIVYESDKRAAFELNSEPLGAKDVSTTATDGRHADYAEILSDTQGVDFGRYLQRVFAGRARELVSNDSGGNCPTPSAERISSYAFVFITTLNKADLKWVPSFATTPDSDSAVQDLPPRFRACAFPTPLQSHS